MRKLDGLSTRQSQVARLIREGKRTRQIARVLGISPHTVTCYIHEIYILRGIVSTEHPRISLALWVNEQDRATQDAAA
jgi:DNA-binding NarL/FixJ family response regulator